METDAPEPEVHAATVGQAGVRDYVSRVAHSEVYDNMVQA